MSIRAVPSPMTCGVFIKLFYNAKRLPCSWTHNIFKEVTKT